MNVISQLPQAASARRTRRRRIMLAIAYVAIAAAVAILAALLINGEDKQSEPPGQGSLNAIQLGERDASAYDPPPGDGTERSEAIPLALDGDPTTAWETERYDTPDFGNIKKGVGLYLDAGRPIVARGVRLVTPKDGWDVRFYVAQDQKCRTASAAGPSSAAARWTPAARRSASTPPASRRATTWCGSRASPKERPAAPAPRSQRSRLAAARSNVRALASWRSIA